MKEEEREMRKQRTLFVSLVALVAMLLVMIGTISPKVDASTPGYYTITFYSGSGSGITNLPDSFEVKDGSLFSLPTKTPIRTGYTFYRWKDSATGTQYKAGQGNIRASSNLKLYPVWNKVEDTGCTTYNYGVCSGAPVVGVSTRDKASTMTVTYEKGKKSSVAFDGWAVHDQGIAGYTCSVSGTGLSVNNVKLSSKKRDDVAAANVLVNMGLNPKASLENSGYYGSVDISKLNPGTYKLTIYGVPNKGSRFAVSVITIKITEPKAQTYTLTYNPNGGSGAKETKTFKAGSAVEISMPSFTHPTKSIIGFSTTKGGKVVYHIGDKPVLKGNTELFTVWGAITITYDYGDNSGRKEVQDLIVLNSAAIWPTSFSKSGYLLAGFSKTKNASKVEYVIGDPYMFYSNTTLYPVWVKLDLNSDGTVNETQMLENLAKAGISKATIEEDVFSRSMYSFMNYTCTDEIRNALNGFSNTNWEEMMKIFQSGKTEDVDRFWDEFSNRVIDLVCPICHEYGIDDIPPINFYSDIPDHNSDYGFYNPQSGYLEINTKYIFQPVPQGINIPHELVDTIAHELRHAYQHQRVCKMENYMDFLYVYNWTNGRYIYASETEQDKDMNTPHKRQIMEAEAWGAGYVFKSMI